MILTVRTRITLKRFLKDHDGIVVIKQVVQQNAVMKIFQRILHVTQMKKYLQVSHCVENLNQQCLGWLVINHLMELLFQPKLINTSTDIHSIKQSLLICVEKLFLIKPQDFVISLVHLWFSWKIVSSQFNIFFLSYFPWPLFDSGFDFI